jgi:hypothetical protein
MIRRRIRGLIGTIVLVCIPWTILGVITGLVFKFRLVPGMEVFTSRPIPGGLPVAFALVGLIAGVINGLAFGALLLAAERGRSVEKVRGWRFGAWGALATAATVGVTFQSGTAAIIGGGLGAMGSAAGLWLARRTGERSTTPSTEALDPAAL